MTTVSEQVAVETLRDIAKLSDPSRAIEMAKKAIKQIDEFNKPTNHNLSAENATVQNVGGGFTKG